MGFLSYVENRMIMSNYMSYFKLGCGRSSAIEEVRSLYYRAMGTSANFDLKRVNLIGGTVKSGGYGATHDTFDEMLVKNDLKWTSMIWMDTQKRFYDRALNGMIQMLRVGVEPSKRTFSITIGACCKSRRVDFGMGLHCLILKKGLLRELFVSSGLITMYSKCDYVDEARQVFDEMLEKDAATWNSMIAAYSQQGLNKRALCLFSLILENGADWKLLVNNFTLASVFKACGHLGHSRIGKSVHSYAIKLGFDSDIFVGGSLVDMYARCGSLNLARCVFDQMKRRDLISWNTMITGYTQNDYGEEALGLFYQLQSEGFFPNETTFSCVLKALTVMLDTSTGRCFHAKTMKHGTLSDVFVGTAIVDMYSKYFEMENARRAFLEMPARNLVSFNALITGYSLTGEYDEALRTYIKLQTENLRPDSYTFAGLFSSCSVLGAFAEGSQVHGHSIMFGLDSDVTVGNSVVNFYARCGIMDYASKAFESVTTPNAISWAGIVSGFAQNGEGEKALEYFCEMHKLTEKPDEFSFSSVVNAVANWATVERGRHLHAYIIKVGLEDTIFVGSVLIDMYSKCGIAEDSFKIFTKIPEKNVVSWNAMLAGYVHNGFNEKALLLFQEMIGSGVKPTSITFIGVLSACSHMGLVAEGKYYYNLMINEYDIAPSVEHCTCMVDLLGHAGFLHEAEALVLKSPFPSEPEIWKCLLAACAVHRNTDIGCRAARLCLQFEPQDSSTYVALSNIYASKQMWSEVTRIRDLMKEMGMEKEPGCSWIEIRNAVHLFVAEDISRCAEEIVEALQSLMLHSKMDV